MSQQEPIRSSDSPRDYCAAPSLPESVEACIPHLAKEEVWGPEVNASGFLQPTVALSKLKSCRICVVHVSAPCGKAGLKI